MDYDHLFKVLVVGHSGVGKTSLLHRYTDRTFSEAHYTTIGVDYKLKTISLEIRGIPKVLKLQMWDTAGQERFNSITLNYFRGAHGVMLVFALDDMDSFQRLGYWMDMVEQQHVEFKYLIGNKCDLPGSVVTDEMVKAFCENYPGMTYIKTSAKTGQRVESAFLDMTTQLAERMIDMENRDKPTLNLHRQTTKEESTSTKCCGGTG